MLHITCAQVPTGLIIQIMALTHFFYQMLPDSGKGFSEYIAPQWYSMGSLHVIEFSPSCNACRCIGL